MAITTSYYWETGADSLLNNVSSAGSQFGPAVAGNPAGDRYVAAWSDPNNSFQVEGRVVDAEQTGLTSEFTVNNGAVNLGTVQFDPSVAGLTGGNFVVTYTDFASDPGGDIRARLYTANGAPLGSDFAIVEGNTLDDQDSSVAALSGGGFVVTYTRELGSIGIRARVFDQNGNISALAIVHADGGQTASSVAGLSSGGFVVVWQDDTDASVYFRRYQSDATPLDADRVLIDTTGAINQDIHVTPLADGGFAVAYTDSGWSIDGTEITFRIFNADGTTRTGFIHANSADLGGVEIGDQQLPTITTMGDLIVVGWLNESNNASYAQVFDAQGNALGNNGFLEFQVAEHELAGLANGQLAHVWQSSISEGAGLADSMRSNVVQLVRQLTGDGADNVMAGIDDGLREQFMGGAGNDVIKGGGGADEIWGGAGTDTVSYADAPAGVTASLISPGVNTGEAAGDVYVEVERLVGSDFNDALIGNFSGNMLIGGAGNDVLGGVAGNDMIDGGSGDDTAMFSVNFNDYIVEDFGARIRVTGPDGGTATLTSIEHLLFNDMTITPADMANDGNPLFDMLYYLSCNADVFQSAMNALDHYNTFGWHEGRDPNSYFDTSGYLAVNQDVAASGMNPLEHYHQSGWQQGRDPSANFDTTLYLINNPDVAAAGIDPLAHFLANGMAEGRRAYMAVGAVSNGFDAQYYLFHNPDVAAAGIDPLFHYNAVGWQEGRDPNAWFDASGYLAYNDDVAAAGINPLQHYEAVGWQEGRDASASFDTLGYLAANPDVAAAGINPLDHFLQFGIYEGRHPVNDGVWS
jgi:Ca2+-binding RTX toxin-like protein